MFVWASIALSLCLVELTGTIEVVRPLTKRRISVETYQNRGAALAPPGPDQGSFRSEMDAVVVYWEAVYSDAQREGKVGTAKRGAVGAGLQAGAAVTLSQKARRFGANLLVVPAGATVSFPNEDPIFHNVFSLSKAKAFDLGYYPQGQTRKVTFTRAGVVDVFCHLHPNMSATILVTPSPYFAKPAADGSFRLEIPDELGQAGEYEIVAWHRAAGFFRRRVRLPRAEGESPLRFVLPLREAD
jgi:plastocyanin